ncbi:MAG TPA: RNA polymerase sigma factor [Planctomycetota bacterium]|jgi:RNA polymerase sigma-70 factor (ECF subfamily)|nr:RNA polymerase sigma factor [Planctomycetota bacterium]
MEEEALVRAARRGERAAFDRLVERYSRAVLARQFGWTRDAAAAEDLAQETFLRAWQGLGRLEDVRAFGSWVLSIAGFVGQEWLRRKQLDQKARTTLATPAAERQEGGRDDGPDPVLARALAELAPDVQQLLALRHDRGMSCEEIARELGRPLGTVTKTLSRAYEQLRARLARR